MKMKKIRIKYGPIISKKTKKNEEEIILCGETFQDLLNLLFKKYKNNIKEYFLDSDEKNLSPSIIVFINNKLVRDLKFKLKDQDEILIMPNIEGG